MHTHNRKPCCVATTQACLLYPDEMKLSQPCEKKKGGGGAGAKKAVVFIGRALAYHTLAE